VQICFFE
jgi:transcriptional regulator with XRE-family HTH domain